MSKVRTRVVIVGPTAGGKSALAVGVARALMGRGEAAEIVTADAFQVYRGMDVGTAKPTTQERAGVVHHLVDVVEPTERFTASDWLARAQEVMEEIEARGGRVVVVGGTHLYVKLLLEGMFEGPAADPALRESLMTMGEARLREELERVDPEAARRIHPRDLRRTVRAIEVHRLTGVAISEHQRQWVERGGRTGEGYLLVGLTWEVEAINRRINARVKAMVQAGLVEEVRGLWEAGKLGPQAREALGYRQVVEALEGRVSVEEALERVKIETRRFAKNQRTWLRRLALTPGSLWLDGSLAGEELVRQVVAGIDAREG